MKYTYEEMKQIIKNCSSIEEQKFCIKMIISCCLEFIELIFHSVSIANLYDESIISLNVYEFTKRISVTQAKKIILES